MPAHSLDKGDDDKQLFSLMACSHLAWGGVLTKAPKLSEIRLWLDGKVKMRG